MFEVTSLRCSIKVNEKTRRSNAVRRLHTHMLSLLVMHSHVVFVASIFSELQSSSIHPCHQKIINYRCLRSHECFHDRRTSMTARIQPTTVCGNTYKTAAGNSIGIVLDVEYALEARRDTTERPPAAVVRSHA